MLFMFLNEFLNMKTLLFLFCLLPTLLFSQTEIKLHVNTRNAKDTSLFDYYGKLTVEQMFDSTLALTGMVNYERDNGIEYYSYSGKADLKYGSVEYYKDTEKQVEYFSLALFYPIFKVLKIGYNYIKSGVDYHSVYLSLKWKWVKADLSFFEKIHIFAISMNPTVKLSDNFGIGFESKLVYVDGSSKWSNGLTVALKF